MNIKTKPIDASSIILQATGRCGAIRTNAPGTAFLNRSITEPVPANLTERINDVCRLRKNTGELDNIDVAGLIGAIRKAWPGAVEYRLNPMRLKNAGKAIENVKAGNASVKDLQTIFDCLEILRNCFCGGEADSYLASGANNQHAKAAFQIYSIIAKASEKLPDIANEILAGRLNVIIYDQGLVLESPKQYLDGKDWLAAKMRKSGKFSPGEIKTVKLAIEVLEAVEFMQDDMDAYRP